MRTRVLLAVGVAAGLAGCTSTDSGLSPVFGMAVASMDNQIIDPTPAEGVPESSGARAVIGLTRYNEHRVVEPPGAYTEKTVQVGSGDKSGGPEGGGGKDAGKP